MSSAYCKAHTNAYRNCLKDCRDAGRSKTASKTCKPLAVKLDDCREEWRIKNPVVAKTKVPAEDTKSASGEGFDGTRILPHPKCRPLSCDVQRCIKWKQGDQSQCQTEIKALAKCMKSTKGTVAKPTEGDKVWSI
mmetsp:Transcript_3519/g.8390  ORF Transcript_3519/g.8390 Transcript_3519/m.8390 type:complete len:135 (-) Transcript_3519:1191-1595(-)